MIANLIMMNGYGLFVWLAFGITFTACLVFYLKTKKLLKNTKMNFRQNLKDCQRKENNLF